MTIGGNFLDDTLFTLRRYKSLGEKSLAQLSNAQVHWKSDEAANSVAILVKHMAGNMRSRWTDFLRTDGEKPDRERDGEFIDDFESREQLMAVWEEGWQTCFSTLESLTDADLAREVTIRGRAHTVVEAINRQVGHYAYHVGQIVQLARIQVGAAEWRSLSIPRGQSDAYDPEGRV